MSRSIRPLTASLTMVFLMACIGGGGSRWFVVRPQDLPLTVPLSGALRAVETASAVLPSIPNVLSFKIVSMAAEGQAIRKGQPLLSLGSGDQVLELERVTTERDQTVKAIEKEKFDLRDRLLELDRQVDEARARLRKQQKKVEVPEDLQSRVELEKSRLDWELAETEVRLLNEERLLQESLGAAQMRMLAGRRERSSQRVADLQRGLREMTVPAARDGLVIYKEDWRGEKRKVGDTISPFDQVLLVADVSRLMAEATVAEMDLARVQVGQRAILRLESDPGHPFPARILSIAPIVRSEGWNNPRKVAFLRLALDRTEPDRMRPGMRFRGDLQVDRVARVLAIPEDTIAFGPTGPVTFRWAGLFKAPEPVALKLGASGGNLIQVLSGLNQGDRILRQPAPATEPSNSEVFP